MGSIIKKIFEIQDKGIGVIETLTDDNLLLIFEANFFASTVFTNSAIPLSVLQSTYGNFNYKIGYRVQCPDISGGGLIYEKTSTSWVKYPITNVT